MVDSKGFSLKHGKSEVAFETMEKTARGICVSGGNIRRSILEM